MARLQGDDLERLRWILWLLALGIGLARLAAVAFDGGRPAGLGINLLDGVGQLPLRTLLPLPRMSLALPLITIVSGGPDTVTESTT
jgi:hypothetical protein